MRAFAIALGLLLGACSPSIDVPTAAYVPPSPPAATAITTGAKQAASEEKLTGPLEMSAVRIADRGMGRYFFCLRQQTNPASGSRRTYAVFYDNDVYKGVRESVTVEACEAQAYSPVS